MKPWQSLSLALLFALALTPLGAQDAVQVSPKTHKVLLENPHVRVFEVRVAAGERVGLHSHPRGVVYFLSDAKLRISYPDGHSEERSVKAGEARWQDPVTHAVENIGGTEFHEIHVEIKDTPATTPPAGSAP